MDCIKTADISKEGVDDRIDERSIVILLAEDDPGYQKLTRRALKKGNIQNHLYVVNNGEEALDYLLHRGRYKDPATSPRPDLLLLDLNMPRIDGRQVLERMCADPDLRRIAVVVLTTSRQEEEDIIRSYDLGCNSFITEPVDMGQFTKIVRALEQYWFVLVALPQGQD